MNLNTHFRDRSDREKFFASYAEQLNRWQRVTPVYNYGKAEPWSLEMDLKDLQNQRDKNAQVYRPTRDSMADVQFYDTVTNLKLQTRSSQLHIFIFLLPRTWTRSLLFLPYQLRISKVIRCWQPFSTTQVWTCGA